MFLATLILRLASIIGIIVTLPVRQALPLWMVEWFQWIEYPLLFYNFILLIFYKKAAVFLQRHFSFLFIDLIIAFGIIQIGGGWRSSYFEYMLTTVMVFTIFGGRKWAYIASGLLAFASLVKDPSGGLPSLEIFDVGSIDMRLGAALFFITAGLIMGYFSVILKRLEKMSIAEIEKTRNLTAMEERTRLALELHDGAKQMVTAMLIMLNPLIKKNRSLHGEAAKELRWLWRGMNYLHSELNQVMDTLKGNNSECKTMFNVIAIAEEEAKIVEVMTGFSWKILADNQSIEIPIRNKLSMRRFFSEAFMNAWKHSGVSTGTVEIKSSGETIIIKIFDDGKGFNYGENKIEDATGLKSLKYRAKELRGELAIETEPDKGCKLTLTIPAG